MSYVIASYGLTVLTLAIYAWLLHRECRRLDRSDRHDDAPAGH